VSHINDSRAVASFDLYDTVVMRRSLTATSVYELVWAALVEANCAVPERNAFVTARERADTASKIIDAPSLAQILEFLDDNLSPLAAEIERIEIQVELAQLRVMTAGKEQLDRLRSDGCRIAFISDMHIGSVHLGPKLQELGLMQEGDLLMVSSDQGFSKSRKGRLFKHFLSVNSISAERVTHYGNSEWSDVKMARKHGLSACLCPPANPNRFETLLIQESSACRALEHMASVSRDVRLQCTTDARLVAEEISPDDNALIDIAASVASPAMVAFVLWAIKRCREESITTIRFLTRDGELPYLIAKALPAHVTEGLDLGMLEVSRRSLLLPAASVLPIDRWLEFGLEPGAFLVQQVELLPARQVIARVGLSFEDDADVLSQFGITDPDAPLGDTGLTNWKEALGTDAVKDLILQYSRIRLEGTEAYLKQNLPGASSQRVGLLDIGWTGQQAAMLSALIRQQGGQDPLHLHIGRLRNKPLIVEADIEGWLFDERVKPSPVENPVALFESFCVTTAGGVNGYHVNSDGTATAVRRTQRHKGHIVSWGQPILRQCVLSYTAQAGDLMSEIDIALLRDTCEKLLLAFWESPQWHEAKKWGSFPYEQDQTGQTIRELSNPYNWAQLQSRLEDSYSGVDWKAGSIELSPSPIRQLLKLREKYRRKQSL